MSVGSLTNVAAGQVQPYGLVERVPNTSLLIDIENGLVPTTISASGLFSDVAAQTPVPGLIPYSVNSEFWSDGASKTRYLALPGEAQIEFARDGIWRFPDNSVLVKNFYVEFIKGDPVSRQIVETRFLVKVGATDAWRGLSYKWNDDASDAVLLPDREILPLFIEDPDAVDAFSEYRYFFPGPQDCTLCHTEAAGWVLGMRTAQLNGLRDYDGILDNQLRVLNHIGVFSDSIGEDYSEFPRWENPLDEIVPLPLRARSYLAVNCGPCHRPGGVDRANIDLRYDTPLAETNTVDWSPMLGRLDAFGVKIINPGNAEKSTLLLRTLSSTSNRMPPVASSIVDQEGAALLRRWIDGLDASTLVASAPQHQLESFALEQNYPNPFNAQTTIQYEVETEGPVDLTVYDPLGRLVRTLVQMKQQMPGRYTLRWDGRDDNGLAVASGLFFYRLRTDLHTETRKLLIVR